MCSQAEMYCHLYERMLIQKSFSKFQNETSFNLIIQVELSSTRYIFIYSSLNYFEYALKM